MAIPDRIKRGHSVAPDSILAARELYRAIAQPDMGLVVFFCSMSYELDTLAAELGRLFGDARVIGCTTAGEIGPTGYLDGSITGFSIPAGDCCAVSELVTRLSEFQISRGHAATEAAMAFPKASSPGAPFAACPMSSSSSRGR